MTPMTDTELNVKLAEALGWEFWSELAEKDGKQRLWKHPEHKVVTNIDEHIEAFKYARSESHLPNYTGSYDAVMPEVMKLNDEQIFQYRRRLDLLLFPKWPVLRRQSEILRPECRDIARALYQTLTQP